MNKFYIFLLLPFLFFGTLQSQQPEQDFNELFEKHQNNGEIYFRFANQNLEIENISRIISINRKSDGNWLYAYANKKQFQSLANQDISVEILQHPGTLIHPKMKSSVDVKNIEEWDFYPTYDAYISMMYQFESLYPDLCRVELIGQTQDGRDLLACVISDNAILENGETQFLYTSTMHGDETAGYVLLLRLIDYLLENYGSITEITTMVDNMEIWINPLANPDGTFAGGNNSVYGATRKNANGVDLNRNYADPEDGPHPDGNEYQTETLAFMYLAENNRFVMSANIHSGTEVCNYPWDTWAQLAADDHWWQYVCHEYADTAQFYSPAGYMDGYVDGITNGYAWYTISGGRQDYMNYFHHCREFTLEISDAFILPENQLEAFWEYNYRSFLNYMEQALYGIRGEVSDSNTGTPVEAKIEIIEHDIDNSWVMSNPIDGWFYRPVYNGTYNITVSADGYFPQTFENVVAQNEIATILNVQLVSSGAGVESNTFNSLISVSPNPGNGSYKISYSGQEVKVINASISDQSGRIIKSFILSLDLNDPYYMLNIQSFKDGIYILNLNSDQVNISRKIIKE